MFVTLEDDSVPVSVIVWPPVADAQPRPLLGARRVDLDRRWQSEGESAAFRFAPVGKHSQALACQSE